MTRDEAITILMAHFKHRKDGEMTDVEKAVRTLVDNADVVITNPTIKHEKKKRENAFEAGDDDPKMWSGKGVIYASRIRDEKEIDLTVGELRSLFKLNVLSEGRELRALVQVVKK